MLRLLRLLRVLKLVNKLPQLQVIITALMMGVGSIGYIGVILCIFFYFFAIIGMIFFAQNDPWHFGSLHMTMLTLFRASTLEDWTDIMYINIYGCQIFGYSHTMNNALNGGGCGSNIAMGKGQLGRSVTWEGSPMAQLYFLIFIMIGALVLLTLFVGVVTTSMEEATEDMKEALEIEEEVQKVAEEENIPQEQVNRSEAQSDEQRRRLLGRSAGSTDFFRNGLAIITRVFSNAMDTTSLPTRYGLSQRAALKLKGKALVGRASPSSINTSAETVDTFTRLSFDPRQHFPSPEKNPNTRWNGGKKLTKDEFEANFLHRQNNYADIREERMRKTQDVSRIGVVSFQVKLLTISNELCSSSTRSSTTSFSGLHEERATGSSRTHGARGLPRNICIILVERSLG